MAEIDITRLNDETFHVTVSTGDSSTAHLASLSGDDVDRLGRGATAEDLIDASFRFLLDREPKESILGEFDLTLIGDYFPDYPERIAGYL